MTSWRWLALTAAAAVAAGVAARRARLEPMLVRGGSMRPTLVPGQRVAVAPPTRPLRRGAVVVVRRPGDGLEVVKRLVGLPGERVQLDAAHELTLGPAATAAARAWASTRSAATGSSAWSASPTGRPGCCAGTPDRQMPSGKCRREVGRSRALDRLRSDEGAPRASP